MATPDLKPLIDRLDRLIEPFEFERFNPHATLGENIIFGIVAGARLVGPERTADRYFRSIIAVEALTDPLVDIGLRIAENTVEVFADLPSGHPLFERFSMIRSSDLDMYASIVEQARSDEQGAGLPEAARARAPDVQHRELWLSGPFGTFFQVPREQFYLNPFNDHQLTAETMRFDPAMRRRGQLVKGLFDIHGERGGFVVEVVCVVGHVCA